MTETTLQHTFSKMLRFLENRFFPPPKNESEGLFSHLKRTFLLICVLTLVTHFVHHNTPLLRAFENPAIDAFVRSDTIKTKYSMLVDINDVDFVELFERKRPLAADMLEKIILAIAAGKPRVIVVDIDTEDASFQKLRQLKVPCKVVWARDAIQVDEKSHSEEANSPHESSGSKVNASSHGQETFPPMAPQAVLGKNSRHDDIEYGFAVTQADANGWIRSYPKRIPVLWDHQTFGSAVSSREITEEETLPWKVVRAANLAADEVSSADEPRQLMFKFSTYPSNYVGYSAGHVLKQVEGNRAGWETIAKDKIVLLGGTYRASGDFHMTPVGRIPGVNLVGYAIESHLQNNTIREINPKLVPLIDVLIGLMCVTIGHYLPRRWAILIIPIVFPAVVFVVSFYCFDKLSVWANFVPLLFGIYLHFVHDHFVEDRELKHELAAARKEISEYKRARDSGEDEPSAHE